MADYILNAVINNLQPSYLAVLMIGTVIGTIIGALPGLSAVSAVALVSPFTFTMEPARGLIMLAAVYQSAEYGGSISAILINTPGTAGACCTMLDGTPLTKKGQAQEALYISLLAGTVGGAFGGLVMLFFTPVLADISLLLGPAEIFWIAVAGLFLVAGLSGKNIVKGLIGVTLGLSLTLIGQDTITGNMRFTFNYYKLVGGIPLVPALLGLFAVASTLKLMEDAGQSVAPLIMRKGALRFVVDKLSRMKVLLAWSSILGTLVGIAPGAGAAIGAFVAYGEAKRISKHPEEFGRGSYEGIAAPECANNADVAGSLIPLLSLGIPGSGTAAVMYGVLTVYGILPGPRLFTERGELVYTFMVGVMFTVVAMLIFGLVTIRWSSLMVHAPNRFLVPGVLALSAIGTYGLSNSLFDVYVLIGLGIVGYLFGKLEIPIATLALGIVLGNLTEVSFQQAVIVGTADAGAAWIYFLTRPVAVILMLCAFAVLVSGIRQIVRSKSDAGDAPATGTRRAGLSMRPVNILLSFVIIALALYGIAEARTFAERAALLPMVLFVALIVLAGVLLFVSLTPRTGKAMAKLRPFSDVPWKLWVGSVVALVLFGLGIESLGFYETAFFFLLLVSWIMSVDEPRLGRRLLTPILFAVAFDAALYVSFKVVLHIPTPPGLLL